MLLGEAIDLLAVCVAQPVQCKWWPRAGAQEPHRIARSCAAMHTLVFAEKPLQLKASISSDQPVFG